MLRIADADNARISRLQDGLGCAPTAPRRPLQALGVFASPPVHRAAAPRGLRRPLHPAASRPAGRPPAGTICFCKLYLHSAAFCGMISTDYR